MKSVIEWKESLMNEKNLVPSWDDYFMEIAYVVSKRSPDIHTKHGCVLVDRNYRILSTGYNGPVSGIPNDVVPLTRPEKYDWLIHAEQNAIAFLRSNIVPWKAYVTGVPCPVCMRLLIQSGVRHIVFGKTQSSCVNAETKETSFKIAEYSGCVLESHNHTYN